MSTEGANLGEIEKLVCAKVGCGGAVPLASGTAALHMAIKKCIYERCKEGLKDLSVTMKPFDAQTMEPNDWLSCMLIDKEAMCRQERSDTASRYTNEPGRTCPDEILEVLGAHNVQARPIWKPMHLQPLYKGHAFIAAQEGADVGADIIERGLCLLSDMKMTEEEQLRGIDG